MEENLSRLNVLYEKFGFGVLKTLYNKRDLFKMLLTGSPLKIEASARPDLPDILTINAY